MRMLFLIGMCVCLALNMQAQESDKGTVVDAYRSLEVEGRLLLFLEELDAISADVMRFNQEQLEKADKKLLGIDHKWMIYNQAHQELIAADEALMNIVVDYQESKQIVADSIQNRLHQLHSFEIFQVSEKYIDDQTDVYKEMFETSQKYALLKQQASLLEKLKTREQLSFAELTKHYEAAKTIVGEFPLLTPRMEKMEEQYIEMKGYSEKIQAAEYKPFMERIKDYLYSFAAVAILLMFVNMIYSKIQAYKQMRKSAEEYKKMLQRNENECPTI